MEPVKQFDMERRLICKTLGNSSEAKVLTQSWINFAQDNKYSYQFDWLGRPIIQYPQDIIAMQELIWHVKPDLIIETGIAHGGSLIMSASLLAMLDYCEAIEAVRTLDPMTTHRRVLGLDIDIRTHNRAEIEAHPMSHHIDMIQGSSIALEVIAQVHEIAKSHHRVLIFLDSNHTHEHVLAELEAYAPITSKGSYCCVFDTVIEDMPEDMFLDRPWSKGDNPKTAVREYLRLLKEDGRKATDGAPLNFEADKSIENKLLITVAPDGYLRRI
jgi:cephalosporin hydroxylase